MRCEGDAGRVRAMIGPSLRAVRSGLRSTVLERGRTMGEAAWMVLGPDVAAGPLAGRFYQPAPVHDRACAFREGVVPCTCGAWRA